MPSCDKHDTPEPCGRCWAVELDRLDRLPKPGLITQLVRLKGEDLGLKWSPPPPSFGPDERTDARVVAVNVLPWLRRAWAWWRRR